MYSRQPQWVKNHVHVDKPLLVQYQLAAVVDCRNYIIILTKINLSKLQRNATTPNHNNQTNNNNNSNNNHDKMIPPHTSTPLLFIRSDRIRNTRKRMRSNTSFTTNNSSLDIILEETTPSSRRIETTSCKVSVSPLVKTSTISSSSDQHKTDFWYSSRTMKKSVTSTSLHSLQQLDANEDNDSVSSTESTSTASSSQEQNDDDDDFSFFDIDDDDEWGLQ